MTASCKTGWDLTLGKNASEPFAPLRGRGPRSGAGVLHGKSLKLTLPLRQAAVWRSGQPLRFISTRSLVHPFAAARHFPSRGNKELYRFPPLHWRRQEHKAPLNLAPPLGGEGHEVARGCCTARASNDTPPGRPPTVRAAFALHLYTQPCTPFCRCAAFLHGKACHWIRGSLRSPMNPVPLPPSRGNKG